MFYEYKKMLILLLGIGSSSDYLGDFTSTSWTDEIEYIGFCSHFNTTIRRAGKVKI